MSVHSVLTDDSEVHHVKQGQQHRELINIYMV